ALKENRGKLTAAATIMVPITAQVNSINATFDQKGALKAAHPVLPNPPPIAPHIAQATAAPQSDVAQVEIAATVTPSIVAGAGEVSAPSSAPRSHRVQRGETLFSISKRYGVAVDKIKILNAMKNNSVQVGQTLSVNGASVTETARVSAPELMRIKAPVKPVQTKPSTYTVRSGDTLYAIATKFAVELDDLLLWNKLSAKSVLQPGNKIRITL
ncbi:MAG: LysM peptidoglycan-binding domain-containing protein, partial [Aeromicrobium sp.]|nr:LysM peptidoglycan-binding domain-containing protein [Burkholderiales bacterium]